MVKLQLRGSLPCIRFQCSGEGKKKPHADGANNTYITRGLFNKYMNRGATKRDPGLKFTLTLRAGITVIAVPGKN